MYFNRYSLQYVSVFVFVNIFVTQSQFGTPYVDYPAYNTVPKDLSFRCDQKIPGYYSDVETGCQVWHWCLPNGQKFSFLCPNGTIFNQAFRVCDWWFHVNCNEVEQYYGVNEDLYRSADGRFI